MKEFFENPTLEIIRLREADVIATSTLNGDGANGEHGGTFNPVDLDL